MDGIKKRRILAYTLCVFLAMWLLASVHAAGGVLQSSIISAYSLSDSGKGLPSSVNTVSNMGAFFLIMFLIGRVRKPAILALGALLGAAALGLLTRGASYPVFLCLLGIVGFSCGCVDSVVSASIADLYPGAGGARVMCALHATYGLSGFSMPILFERVMKDGSAWRGVYGVLGALALVVGALILLASAGHMQALESPGASSARFSRQAVARLFCNARVRAVWLVIFFLGMYMNGMLVWTPRYMEFGLESGMKTVALSAIYLGITLSRVLFALLKVDTQKYMRLAMPLATAFFLVGVLAKNETVALVCLFSSAFATGPVIPFCITLACAEAPKDSFLATAITLVCCFLGQTLFAPFFGKMETLVGISGAMLFCALALLISSAVTLFAPGREKRA